MGNAGVNGAVSLLVTMFLYIAVAYAATYQRFSFDWCGWRLLWPVIVERSLTLLVMAVIYLKLASLAEIGLPERYALVYYTLIAIVAELIGQKLIPHQAGVRKGEMGARKPRDNLGGQFLPERIHLVPQRIRLKKRDVVDRIMSVPRPKEALRNLIDSSDHLKRRSKKDLYALLSADPVTRDTAFQIVNEVGLAHAKLFAPTAPHR